MGKENRNKWRGAWNRDGPAGKAGRGGGLWSSIRAAVTGRAGTGTHSGVGILLTDNWKDLGILGYTPLDKNPEIMTACRKIASTIGATTIHLMRNTPDGDVREKDGLARMVDVTPMPNMTRPAWMEAVVMNLLLYGDGNSIVLPRYDTAPGAAERNYLRSLEPVAPARVALSPVPGSWTDYSVYIDGRAFAPEDVLHFAYNPDAIYPWKGRGIAVSLRDVADNLRQAQRTTKAFLSTEYKPSIIIKADALTAEFSGPEGRRKLLESYIKPPFDGAPWIIPAEQFQVEQVKPLTLSDLAISSTVELDRRAVASILGVPPFVVGVGDYKAAEWNWCIQSTIIPICKAIAAEMTRKLLISPDRYFRFNLWSMMDHDLEKVSRVLLAGSDRGYVNGDTWRDRVFLPPAGLKEYRVLENYIPVDLAGFQKKLKGVDANGGDEE